MKKLKPFGAMEPWRNLLAYYTSRLTLGFTVLLPFLALFNSANKNLDLQGIILLCAGACAWLNIALNLDDYKRWFRSAKLALIAVGIFLLIGLASSIVSPHLSFDFLGAPYVRLGYLSLLAIIGCSVYFLQFKDQLLLKWLYAICVLLAITAIPYNLIRLHELSRVGGVFAQADILSIFVGLGLFIGWQLIAKYQSYKLWLYLSQLMLILVLILTQTRVVIGLVIVLSLLWFVLNSNFLKQRQRQTITVICSVVVLITIGLFLLPARVTSPSYAEFSVKYRLELQEAAIKASFKKPLLGYGIGNLADALSCKSLQAASLKQTCHDGYFFNSSHNIYLDRVLAFGWIGGLAYLLFVVTSLIKGLRKRSQSSIVLVITALLIGLYYLTNITGIEVELVFWVLLIRLSFKKYGVANQG